MVGAGGWVVNIFFFVPCGAPLVNSFSTSANSNAYEDLSIYVHTWSDFTLLEPQSCFGEKLLGIEVHFSPKRNCGSEVEASCWVRYTTYSIHLK